MPKFHFDRSGKAQYARFERDVQKVIDRKVLCGVFTGTAGIGKTQTVLNLLSNAGYVEGDIPGIRSHSYKYVKGHISPAATFQLFNNNPDKLIIFDDCDAIFSDRRAANILKGAVDDKPQRVITWALKDQVLTCIFTGSVILLSNSNQLPAPLYDRGVGSHMEFTNEEILERMVHIVNSDTFYPQYGNEAKQTCIDFIAEQSEYYEVPFSLRLLGMALDWYHQFPEHWQEDTVAKMLNR